jgi:hypothetical protein
LEKNSAAIYIQPKPQQAADLTKKKMHGGKKQKQQASVPFEDRLWDPKAAQAALEASRQKFRTVDVRCTCSAANFST